MRNPSGNVLGGLAIGAGRKIGGMISHKLDGANMVHATAIQGLFNAHAQQAEHEHHLKSLREASKIAGDRGFTVNTGVHSFSVGKGKGGGKAPSTELVPANGGGHSPEGNRTPPASDHYENGRKFADGLHDRMNEIRSNAQGASQVGEAAQNTQQAITSGRKAIAQHPEGYREPSTPIRRGGRDSVTAGPNVERVNGAIPLENKGGNPMKDTTMNTGANGRSRIIDTNSPQEFVDTVEKNPNHYPSRAGKVFDEIAAERRANGTAKFQG